MRSQLTQLSAGLMVMGLSACSTSKVATERTAVALDPSSLVPSYSVATYAADRDPATDLITTIQKAKSEQKRILLEVGGNWCVWCRALDQFVHDNPAVAAALHRNFIIMKVNYSDENPNERFLSAYPDIPGFPHFYVLDSNGRLLHSQGTAELEQGQSYNESAFLAFLKKWAPAPD